MLNWIKLCTSLPRAEQKLSRCRERERERDVCTLNRNWAVQRERERCVCARWTETEQTWREREMCERVLNRNWADRQRERERGVCACWESKTSCSCSSTGDSQRLNTAWALFFRENLKKGSAMLLSWQHCASPFLQLRVRPVLIAC